MRTHQEREPWTQAAAEILRCCHFHIFGVMGKPRVYKTAKFGMDMNNLAGGGGANAGDLTPSAQLNRGEPRYGAVGPPDLPVIDASVTEAASLEVVASPSSDATWYKVVCCNPSLKGRTAPTRSLFFKLCQQLTAHMCSDKKSCLNGSHRIRNDLAGFACLVPSSCMINDATFGKMIKEVYGDDCVSLTAWWDQKGLWISPAEEQRTEYLRRMLMAHIVPVFKITDDTIATGSQRPALCDWYVRPFTHQHLLPLREHTLLGLYIKHKQQSKAFDIYPQHVVSGLYGETVEYVYWHCPPPATHSYIFTCASLHGMPPRSCELETVHAMPHGNLHWL